MAKGIYQVCGKTIQFHHIGILYKVGSVKAIREVFPEENSSWMMFNKIKVKELTPFAKAAVFYLQ